MRAFGLEARLLAFGLTSVGLEIVPVFLNAEVRDLLNAGDLVTLSLAPPLVLGSAWAVCWSLREESPSRRVPALAVIVLSLGSILYAEGVGVNLTANAIARHLGDQHDTSLWRLVYFLDEHLGHLLWHAGTLGLSVGLLAATPPGVRTSGGGRWLVFIGAVLFGFNWFAGSVEGQTVPLMFPAAVSLAAVSAVRGGRPLAGRPVDWFMTTAMVSAILLFSAWWILQRGFPQFSDLGWI